MFRGLWLPLIMKPALSDVDHARFDSIDQTMFLGDAARPEASQYMLERFGFAEPLIMTIFVQACFP